MKIILYDVKDNQAIATFFREIFKESGWEERPSDHMDQPQLLFHIPQGGFLVVAKDNEHVIGTAGVILLNKTDGLIKRFYVSKPYRGTGTAQRLFEMLLTKAKTFGIEKLILDVSKNNARAIRFYEKCGFLPTTVEPREDWPESKQPETHFYLYKTVT